MDVDNELPIPKEVSKADVSVEVLRVWIADGQLCYTLRPTAFRDGPESWGKVLFEVLNHVSDALCDVSKDDYSKMYPQILGSMMNQLRTTPRVVKGAYINDEENF